MKKLLLLFAPLTLGLMVGCSYDDSAILDKIAEMEKEHDEMQAQIDAQQTLLDALANKLTITAVTETENGYIVKFSDGSTATISDGKDGDSFLKSIVVGEEDVTFTLADGTVIVIPLGCGGSSDGGEPSAEDNKIYYTTTDGKKLFPTNSDGATFGAILISNTYDNGQGVLVFDDTITSIGERAFEGCSNLASVTILNGVTSIGELAFEGCSSLASVTIPDSVTSIGDYAFNGCSSLASVTIGNGVTSIGGAAFKDCSSLTSVTIPDSVISIGGSTFFGCSRLASITIPDGVTLIKSYAFYGCSSLESITIPNSVTSIGESAFDYCTSLTSITIPDSVTSIGIQAFEGCTSLASITIPDSVISIGNYAFRECSSLTSITIPDSAIEIGNWVFSGCTSLTDTYVNITDLAAYATGNRTYYWFPGAKHLMINGIEITELVIPFKEVEMIGDSAFSGCTSLTSITIPDTVFEIGSSAFDGCTSLTSVYCKSTTPPSGNPWMFDSKASGRKIYVPTESVNAYKKASYWSEYANDIVGYDFE